MVTSEKCGTCAHFKEYKDTIPGECIRNQLKPFSVYKQRPCCPFWLPRTPFELLCEEETT